MGLMKGARTAWLTGTKAVSSGDQAVYDELRRREEKRRELFAPRESEVDTLGSVYFRTDYVGLVPTAPGRYLLVDVSSEREHLVRVAQSTRGLLVETIGQSAKATLEEFNREYYRWFRFSSLTDDDISDILGLSDDHPQESGSDS